jgi:tRNA(fMet)-specific endonuclease VapC
MCRFLLDTDHLSMLLAGDTYIYTKVEEYLGEVGVTIITVQEVFNGWVVRINDRAQNHQLVSLYTKLWSAVEYLKEVPIINFDENADRHYQRLLINYPDLRKNRLQKDLRIAAIALSINATVVTRNQRDFSLMPNLAIEDWTQQVL